MDIITQLFGFPDSTEVSINMPKENAGTLKSEHYICDYDFSYKATKGEQFRKFEINGKEYNLDTKDNLHKLVYKDLIKGRGVKPKDVLPLIKLVQELYDK